jgi:hypothetical protein
MLWHNKALNTNSIPIYKIILYFKYKNSIQEPTKVVMKGNISHTSEMWRFYRSTNEDYCMQTMGTGTEPIFYNAIYEHASVY